MTRPGLSFITLILVAGLSRTADAQDTAAAAAAQISAGKTVYEGKAGGALCISCHGPKGKGVAGLGPDLTDTKWLHGDGSATFLQSIVKSGVLKPKAGVLTMPPMGGGRLSDEQLAALAAYLVSIR